MPARLRCSVRLPCSWGCSLIQSPRWRVTSPSVFGFLILVVIAAPILEELIFRGCIQSWLCRRFLTPVAIVAATAAFTALHAGGAHLYNMQLAAIAMDGLVFGVVYQLSGSLLADIAAHMALNPVTLITQLTGIAAPLEFALLAAGVPAIAFWECVRFAHVGGCRRQA